MVFSVLHRFSLHNALQTWTGKAREYCEQWSEPRKVAEVQKNLEAIQRALQEREKRYVIGLGRKLHGELIFLSRQGASVEQIAAEVNKRQAALETARRDLKLMMQLNKVFLFYYTNNRPRLNLNIIPLVLEKVHKGATQPVA